MGLVPAGSSRLWPMLMPVEQGEEYASYRTINLRQVAFSGRDPVSVELWERPLTRARD